MPFTSVNPTTGEAYATFAPATPHEIDATLKQAESAFHDWRQRSFPDRAALMVRVAELLEGEVPVVAQMMTAEMGKTFAAAKGEVVKCAMALRYYAEHAEELLATQPVATSASRSGVRYQPLGAVLAIMPWNFPLWQVIRFAAPNLMAGNVGILKHAPNVPTTAGFLGELFRRAGCPDGVFTNLYAEVDDVATMISDARVAAVTLTGSERAGRAVAAIAGAQLKKCVMELGGSDAFVVASSADLAHTVPLAVTARVQNNGQSCIAAKRFVVVRERADEFTQQFAAAMAAATIGDPMDNATIVGPLVSDVQRKLLDEQVRDGVHHGARALTGGTPMAGAGFFYPPTVLVDVPTSSRAGGEELFGPVAVVRVAEDLAHAMHIANETPWGLGGSIWATDESEIDYALAHLDAGMVFANAVVASQPELPFGGVKNSGFGRELGELGIKEFTNSKSFFVA